MPALDESDYIPSSGEEEGARNAATGEAKNTRQHVDNPSAASPTPSPLPQRRNNARRDRGRTIFRDEHGAPIGFLFDPSVRKQHKEAISQRIRDRGGQVVLTEEEADTVLVSLNYSQHDLQAKQASYLHSEDPALRKIWVEKTSFVKDCIEVGKLCHKRKRETQQGFRSLLTYLSRRRRRTEYTADDDQLLCKFLWQETVSNGGKGRTGLKLYRRMVSMGEHAAEHRWTKRHPAESWRTRYKTHRARLDTMIEKIAAEAPDDVRQHFVINGRYAPPTHDGDEGSENDNAVEPESEEEERPRQRRRTVANNRPRRARKRPRLASASPPRPSGSGLQRNTREEEAQPESEEEVQGVKVQGKKVQEEEVEEEMHQEQDSLFDGPYDELALAGDHTQATLVNISAERREDSNDQGPSHSARRKVRETGMQVGRMRALKELSPPRPSMPARPEIPRKAARRPRPPIPSSPPPEEHEEYMPQSSPARQPENSSPVQRQQDPSRVSNISNLIPRNTEIQRVRSERPQPFAARRSTLPRPIVANPSSLQASSSRVQPQQSIPQGRPAQGIYPVISPSHRIAPTIPTPVRQGSISSSNSDDPNFPIYGSKANSLKKFLREEHIRTPYTAAPGTRAAAYLSPGM